MDTFTTVVLPIIISAIASLTGAATSALTTDGKPQPGNLSKIVGIVILSSVVVAGGIMYIAIKVTE